MTATQIANIIAEKHQSDERLKAHCWSDEQIAAIPTESLATMAFQRSENLTAEFSGNLETFLVFYRAARAGRVRREGRG